MDDGSEVPGGSLRPAKITEVLRLSAALTDQVLDAQIMKHEIPVDQIAALVRAAGLLQDHAVAWPALMEQVLHEFAERPAATIPTPAPAIVEPIDEGPITGLSRFLSAVRREKTAI